MINRENDKHEAKERIDFLVMMLQNAMKTCNVQVGFNLKTKKLLIYDNATGFKGDVDLEELNKSIDS